MGEKVFSHKSDRLENEQLVLCNDGLVHHILHCLRFALTLSDLHALGSFEHSGIHGVCLAQERGWVRNFLISQVLWTVFESVGIVHAHAAFRRGW